MKKESELLKAADFFEKLQQDTLDTSIPFSIIGMVKKSEGKEKAIEFAPGGNCSNWVTIPLELIEDVEIIKTIACRDHTHPLVKLNMITPKTAEGKIFFALLESMKNANEGNQGMPPLPTNPEQASNNPGTIARFARPNFGSSIGPSVSTLGAWGCWDSTCWKCTHYKYVCNGTACWWICDAGYEYPCERCIWPW